MEGKKPRPLRPIRGASISEDILETFGSQNALVPFQQPVRVRGADTLLDLGSQRTELQAKQPEQHPGFPLLTADHLKIVSLHGQRVDTKGQFAGIDLDAKLPSQDQERLEEVVQSVGQALRRAGYTGPFGLDAWHYRRPDGSTAFHPLGEINARMTFGLVARAMAERRARQS